MKYRLSILIPTLASRTGKLLSLLQELNYQIQLKPVQVLWLGDNKSMSVGEKRNRLMQMASGDFIAYVDDDDQISENYVEVLLEAAKAHPDKTVICFRGTQNTDGKEDIPFRYDVNFGRNYKKVIDGQRWKCMLPDHLCAWNRPRMIEPFPEKSLGEDHAWAKAMAWHYTEEDQVLLTDTLYHYEYNSKNTETRRR